MKLPSISRLSVFLRENVLFPAKNISLVNAFISYLSDLFFRVNILFSCTKGFFPV